MCQDPNLYAENITQRFTDNPRNTHQDAQDMAS